MKLAAHLAQASCERTLYIFDEPTTGLHFDDIAKLLAALERYADRENGAEALLIIEQQSGCGAGGGGLGDRPGAGEGGALGGEVVAAGTPEEIAAEPRSYTGRYLGMGAEEPRKAKGKARKAKVVRGA